jgi:hypothetical protein
MAELYVRGWAARPRTLQQETLNFCYQALHSKTLRQRDECNRESSPIDKERLRLSRAADAEPHCNHCSLDSLG